MKLYVNSTLKIVEDNNFKGQDGKEVSYHTNFIKSEDGEILQATSARDFTEEEGQSGIAVINVRERENGGFKCQLSDFLTDSRINLPEEAVGTID